MVVGYGMMDLFMEGVESLKGKRAIVLKIMGRTRHHFPVSISEVDMQNLWQRSRLGYCVVGANREMVQRILDQVVEYVESLHLAQITQVETGYVVEKGQRV